MFRHQFFGPIEVREIFPINAVNKQNFSDLLRQFKKYKLNSKKINQSQHDLRAKLSIEIYQYTKEFLDNNKDILSPREKGRVLEEYITLWESAHCILEIKNTDYANQYINSRFGKYFSSYNECCPMVAGFNLQGALLGKKHYSNMIFLSVNFEKADFSNIELPYSHFENCNLSEIKSTSDTNFNQCRFEKCNFQKASLQSRYFCEVIFNKCNFREADLTTANFYKLRFENCNLQEADFKEANLKETNFHKCNIYQTQFNYNCNFGTFDCVNCMLFDCINDHAAIEVHPLNLANPIMASPVDASPDGNGLTKLQASLLKGFGLHAEKFGVFSPTDAAPDDNPVTESKSTIKHRLC